ncbi:transcriptional regulator [Streptomyces minutiscleroticus]|uniref:Transcriptional regulator n=1 Tax=Streptomyces minutiscleroticus TaxID=68238 RepID=A0A918U5Y0_9ACTN|nr:GAF and ANTAR domain-containing protein [Streptomyces minutiscleroticus]GGX96892.1 transcriptional regulator [Streptomyces minutiscleroticus]
MMSGTGSAGREERLAAAFIELADTLVDNFDILDFLHTLTEHAVDLLRVEAAGVILLDARGRLVDATASDETTRLLELAQIQWEEGPCRDCARGGRPVDADLKDADVRQRWPRFTQWALARGFTGVAGVPLRLRAEVIGALNLFHIASGVLSPGDLRLGQALADAATIGLLQHRAVHDRTVLHSQIRSAQDSRIVLERAKGLLAEHTGLSLDEAFTRMRRHARLHRMLLTDLATAVVDGSASLEEIARSSPTSAS